MRIATKVNEDGPEDAVEWNQGLIISNKNSKESWKTDQEMGRRLERVCERSRKTDTAQSKDLKKHKSLAHCRENITLSQVIGE